MPQQVSIQNNFIGGLKTEFTGLNFPENAATDTSNCVYSLIGEVSRREGINFEAGHTLANLIAGQQLAINTYRWRNAGGDGQTELLVVQAGAALYFYRTSTATQAISTQELASTVTISNFQAANNVNTVFQTECQFSDGNGYLFVYHPFCDPFYCTYTAGTITANLITVQIRDFIGVQDGLPVTNRPLNLSSEHQYNLQNQGWTSGATVTFNETVYDFSHTSGFYVTTATGPTDFWAYGQTNTLHNVPTGLSLSNGQSIQISFTNGNNVGTGVISSYVGSTLQINFTSASWLPNGNNVGAFQISTYSPLIVQTVNTSLITTWNTGSTAVGGYPSDSDVWWEFKTATGLFNPASTIGNVTLNAGPAPKGYYILNAFIQQRTNLSQVTAVTDVTTTVRPRTGCWFQGRVWYAGVDASQAATGDAQFYTWTENIYFSQIVTDVSKFGLCYQSNDPTSETLNELLPSDGGVIVIQGSGAIYKLFPISNGVIVFAANGTYFITGNTGIGFTANDYTVTKLKTSVQCISGTSFVDVLGMPVFWNEEGIYRVVMGQSGLEVEPLTIGTIRTFYQDIPKDSKLYTRGTYDPLAYTISWVYRSTEESGISNRYQFDTVLNMRILGPRGPEVAFYPYTVSNNGACYVSGINYVNYPTGTIDPTVKYLTVINNTNVTFSEENDSSTWRDWFSYDSTGVDYTSYFVTGYMLKGKSLVRGQSNYVYMFADNSDPYAYTIQGQWDYANTTNANRWSVLQTVTNFSPNYNFVYRRHKIRGHGMSLQIKVSSVSGQPFNIIGWSMHDYMGNNA